MVEIVPVGSTVLDLGCGTGDLLRRLAPKIAQGVGIDVSQPLIAYARAHAVVHSHITFEAREASPFDRYIEPFDVATATLLFHVLPWATAVQLVQAMADWGRELILAGFVPPKNSKERRLLWMDQRLSGHYQNYVAYQRQGGLAGLRAASGLEVIGAYQTFDSTIQIWQMQGREK